MTTLPLQPLASPSTSRWVSVVRAPRLTPAVSLLLTIYTVWALGVLAVHQYNTARPADAPALVLCPMKLTTGLPCPTCGGTRAATALARLDLAGAWHLNPLLTIALPVVLGGIVLRVVFGYAVRVRLDGRARRTAWALATIAFVLNWAWVIRVGD